VLVQHLGLVQRTAQLHKEATYLVSVAKISAFIRMDFSKLRAQLDALKEVKAKQLEMMALQRQMRELVAKEKARRSGVPTFPPVPTHPIIIKKGPMHPIHEDLEVPELDARNALNFVPAAAAPPPPPSFNIFAGMRKNVIASGEKLLTALGRRGTLPETHIGKLNGTIKKLRTLSTSKLVRGTANAPRMQHLADALTEQKRRMAGGTRRLRKKGRKTRSRK
jgi:hypothetical protein